MAYKLILDKSSLIRGGIIVLISSNIMYYFITSVQFEEGHTQREW